MTLCTELSPLHIFHPGCSLLVFFVRMESSGDGISVVLGQRGKLLVWDATCSDTFAPSYIATAASGAGLVAAAADGRKTVKYSNLAQTHHFVPIAIVTSGMFGPATAVFIKELGHRLRWVTGDDLSHHHLVQRLSVAIRGNCASVLGSARSGDAPLNFFIFVFLTA